MLLDIVKKGSTDRSVVLRIIDDTDGTPETGVVWNSAGIDLWYRREGEAVTSITEATLAALTTAHTDGGFLAISHGYYRLDLPDAAYATGANYVDVGGTVTGMVVIGGRVRLVNFDLEDAVRGGMTALPNAAADAAGGLPISDAGALDLDTILGRITGNVALASIATEARLAELDAANLPTDIAAVKTDTGNLVTRITATLFSGITSLAEWLGLLGGKQAGDATARTELRATGAGAGTFDETTDSQEAIRDTAPLGTAMRGTDSAALASVCTEARLAELDAANLPAGVDAILDDTGVSGVQVADKAGYSIGAGGIPVGGFAAGAINDAAVAADAETAIANAIKAAVVEQQGSITLQQVLSIVLASVAGVTSAGGATFKDPSGVATRIAATINASNERTAMTLTPSA